MGNQNEKAFGGRLFQHFQKRVRCIGVHLVGAIDDCHMPAPAPSALAEEPGRAADFFHGDNGFQFLGFLVCRAAQQQKIHMAEPGDLPEGGIGLIHLQARYAHCFRRFRVAVFQDEARHAVGKRCFADALRPRQQPGVMHAPAHIGIEKSSLGFFLADQLACFARRGKIALPVGFR